MKDSFDPGKCHIGSSLNSRVDSLEKVMLSHDKSIGILKKFMWISIGVLLTLSMMFGGMKLTDVIKYMGG